jgi:hypothetical protein
MALVVRAGCWTWLFVAEKCILPFKIYLKLFYPFPHVREGDDDPVILSHPRLVEYCCSKIRYNIRKREAHIWCASPLGS